MSGVLFQVRNRRGLGHLMRSANIGEALAARSDAPRLAFHLAAAPPAGMWNPEFTTTIEAESPWAAVVGALEPDVVVYDTVVPAEPTRNAPDHTRFALVLRRRADEGATALYESAFAERVDRIIVPHRREDFTPPLPEQLLSRTTFVGTIARRPDPSAVTSIRSQRCVDRGFLLTSTVGGGGFALQADRFFELIAAASTLLAEEIDGLQHVIVLGPNYRNQAMIDRLASLPCTRVVQSEQRMVELMAASDLVIAEAGYNTVSEIQLVQVPAVLVPSARTLDDQAERAERLRRQGCVEVMDPSIEPTVFAERVVALASNRDRLVAMRQAGGVLDLGNERAAAIIAELAGSVVLR